MISILVPPIPSTIGLAGLLKMLPIAFRILEIVHTSFYPVLITDVITCKSDLNLIQEKYFLTCKIFFSYLFIVYCLDIFFQGASYKIMTK